MKNLICTASASEFLSQKPVGDKLNNMIEKVQKTYPKFKYQIDAETDIESGIDRLILFANTSTSMDIGSIRTLLHEERKFFADRNISFLITEE